MATSEQIDLAIATYEELMDLDKDFEDVETEIIRQQVALTKSLYEKREALVKNIPNFWALVFEQAPPDLDQYIQPSDSAVLLSALTSVSVSHFEIENGGNGDPRSVSIKMEFGENEWFEDKVLEKKFYYRVGKEGDEGLVSDPVPIKWKSSDKDLTQGMLDLVVKVWENDKKNPVTDSTKLKKEKDYTPDEKALKEKIEATGLGAVSFFGFFGYRGLNISAEESRLAIEEEKKRKAERAAGKIPELKAAEEEEDDDEDDEEEDPLSLEIFPDGEEVALAISDDLWVNAIKYFSQAQEADISEVDFEDDDEDEEMADDDEKPKANGAQPPSKKRKA
ncbi:putative nucleosome assembly protein C36B7.08c [Daldinia childiae]|uniref:putative nucleosome assembly protein C36B7.08c n=1 Tax=Daldinia childiae TaxID=326645 RepID=UPI00144754F7|nr:putative nucleosome assembly protein C36B7.08c [Daldinia childiae]KAF3063642.1 putative nucleosome assembly protein C36B7.08c [Daldinia childiae]